MVRLYKDSLIPVSYVKRCLLKAAAKMAEVSAALVDKEGCSSSKDHFRDSDNFQKHLSSQTFQNRINEYEYRRETDAQQTIRNTKNNTARIKFAKEHAAQKKKKTAACWRVYFQMSIIFNLRGSDGGNLSKSGAVFLTVHESKCIEFPGA